MAKTNFATLVTTAVADAREMSEAWIGTLISDKIDSETNALVLAVENGDKERVTEVLLPQLLSTIQYAENKLQHQEG